jgi:iron complex transport system ATP-binding protein
LRDGKALQEGSKVKVLTDDALTAAFGMPMHVGKQGEYYTADVGD